MKLGTQSMDVILLSIYKNGLFVTGFQTPEYTTDPTVPDTDGMQSSFGTPGESRDYYEEQQPQGYGGAQQGYNGAPQQGYGGGQPAYGQSAYGGGQPTY